MQKNTFNQTSYSPFHPTCCPNNCKISLPTLNPKGHPNHPRTEPCLDPHTVHLPAGVWSLIRRPSKQNTAKICATTEPTRTGSDRMDPRIVDQQKKNGRWAAGWKKGNWLEIIHLFVLVFGPSRPFHVLPHMLMMSIHHHHTCFGGGASSSTASQGFYFSRRQHIPASSVDVVVVVCVFVIGSVWWGFSTKAEKGYVHAHLDWVWIRTKGIWFSSFLLQIDLTRCM